MTELPLVRQLAEITGPLAASLGLSLWGIELAFGGRSLVRVYVERPTDDAALSAQRSELADNTSTAMAQGVSIDDCAELSRLLSLALDVDDVVPSAYVLEVSSPGLDRVFFTEEQLAGAVGQTVELTFIDPPPDFPGRRKFRGVLAGAPSTGEDGIFLLRLDESILPDEEGTQFSFAFSDLKKARQVHVQPEKVLPGKGGKKKGQAKSKDAQNAGESGKAKKSKKVKPAEKDAPAADTISELE